MHVSLFDICDEVVKTLNKEQVVFDDVTIRPEGRNARIMINLTGVRQRGAGSDMVASETAEVYARLRDEFPELSGFAINYNEAHSNRRWERIIEFEISRQELEQWSATRGAQVA